MTWRHLAFLHWRVDPNVLRPRLPQGLELDEHDGSAWVGVVPFEMKSTRFACAPPIPTATDFPELNLRTYVTHRGRAGVWFFSLDAASRLAVRGARATFALPYMDASMGIDVDARDEVSFRSERRYRGVPGATFQARYRPAGPPITAASGTLEHFLTERYSLFSQRGYGVRWSMRGGLVRGDIEHEPWPLQPAEVELDDCDMFRLVDLPRPSEPPLAHFAKSVDVLAFRPYRCQ